MDRSGWQRQKSPRTQLPLTRYVYVSVPLRTYLVIILVYQITPRDASNVAEIDFRYCVSCRNAHSKEGSRYWTAFDGSLGRPVELTARIGLIDLQARYYRDDS